jgi:hypothetical protein
MQKKTNKEEKEMKNYYLNDMYSVI